mgnify:CR=1 FL=1
MSKYHQYLTDISERQIWEEDHLPQEHGPPEVDDYSVDDFIDDVEEILNLKHKGYIACIKKIIFQDNQTIILNKQLEEADKACDKLKEKNDELVKNMVCHYDKELKELKASEQLASHVAKVNADDIVELRKENEKLKEDMKKTWDYVSTCGDTVESGLINLLNPPASDEESEEESEEEDLYGDDDDWVWADVCGSGGYRGEKDEYTLHISGGGDPNTPNGFENWVIKKNVKDELEYFIRHGGDIPDKKQVGKILVRSPDGKYVSWQDEDYEFREVDGDRENDFEWLLEDEEFVSYQVKEMAVLSEVITEYLKDPKPITKEMGEMMDEVIKALSEV